MSIEAYPSQNGVLTSLIWRKTMSGGETSLSGYDNASQALSYTPGQEQVYLNGILLVRGDDYTATNGTSVTGLSALAASDFVQINCYNNYSVATLPVSSLVGSVANNQLQNSAITINGTSTALGGSVTIDALPSQSTHSGKYLTTDGSTASWGTVSSYSAPTLGSTSIASGSTVTTVAGLTLTSPTINDPKLNLTINAQTGTTYTFVLADNGKLVTASNGSAQTYSIPTNASVAFPVGTQINLIQIGAGQVTVSATTPGTTTILSNAATAAAPKCRNQYASLTAIKVGTDLWYVIGDIA